MFTRLFALFMLMVVVIYMIVAGLFMQYVSRERTVEENTLANRVASSTMVMEEEIRAVVNVQLQLLSDSRVAQLALGLYPDDYERGQLILELMTFIESTQSINSIIEEIVISFPMEQIELSSDTGYQKKDFTQTGAYHAPKNNADHLILHDGHLELILSSPLTVASADDYVPDFLIRIVLSQEHLQNFIAQFCGTEHESAFWVYSDKNHHQLPYSHTQRDDRIFESWSGSERSWEEQLLTDTIQVEDGEYFISSSRISNYNLTLVTYQDSNAIAWSAGNTLMNMAVIFLAMGIMFLFLILWANKTVTKPLRIIVEALETVRSGHETVRLHHQNRDEFGVIYESFNHMVDRIEELIENVREKEALRQRAEMIQLQSQINPHFLYNSFYNIKFLAHNEEYEQIETLVTALAKYYRFLNKETDQVIDLAGEVAHMENYIEIQQMRFSDMINVETQELPPEWASYRVPKLILQPIVENAYNYGLRNTVKGGLLRVSYHQEGTLLYIDIEDNGGTMTQERVAAISDQMNTFSGDSLNHALTNIQRRMRLFYGEKSGILLSPSEKHGLRVRVVFDAEIHL